MTRPQPDKPGPGQESVWDYPRPPRLEPIEDELDICLDLKRSLKWDPVAEAFVGDEEANRLRSRAMRVPWQV